MSTAGAFSVQAGELLLGLLEQPYPLIAGQFLDVLHPADLQALKFCGALRPAGASDGELMAHDDDFDFLDFDGDAETGITGRFDAYDGFVAADPATTGLWQVDLDWWLGWLQVALGVDRSSRLVELVPQLVWDLGDFRISGRHAVPLLFARRLHVAEVATGLANALRGRSGRSGGILLTSTRAVPPWEAFPGRHHIKPVVDVLGGSFAAFRLDLALILSPYIGGSSAGPAAGIELSPDGRVLTLPDGLVQLRGEKQIAIVRQLVDAWHKGERLRSAEVLRLADSSADSFAKAFKGSPHWRQLKTVLRQENGMCWLEI